MDKDGGGIPQPPLSRFALALPGEWEDGMLRHIIEFWRRDQAQDLVEYSLLVAFICLSGAAFFISVGQLTSSIWGIVNTRLAASNNAS